jgi:hypothetical protein
VKVPSSFYWPFLLTEVALAYLGRSIKADWVGYTGVAIVLILGWLCSPDDKDGEDPKK